MYPQPRSSTYDKTDIEKRWHLTDRVFFACGACHVLAYAFLECFPEAQAKALWLKPAKGFSGNHIFVSYGDWAFDYHGFSKHEALIQHFINRARHYWPDWKAELIELPKEVLISEAKSKTYDGLWLREPDKHYLHDALPRAQNFIQRFSPPPACNSRSHPARSIAIPAKGD